MSHNKLFEIESQTDYAITITRIENIEDCGDNFITEEELRDMGITGLYFSDTETRVLRAKIRSELQALIAAIPKGKKSIIIPNADLVQALKDSSRLYAVSDFLEGTRRVGNRLFIHTKKVVEQKEVKYSNWTQLVNAYERIMHKTYKVRVSIRLNDSDRSGFVKAMKKGISWQEVVDTNLFSDADLVWCKKLWDNPELISKDSKK